MLEGREDNEIRAYVCALRKLDSRSGEEAGEGEEGERTARCTDTRKLTACFVFVLDVFGFEASCAVVSCCMDFVLVCFVACAETEDEDDVEDDEDNDVADAELDGGVWLCSRKRACCVLEVGEVRGGGVAAGRNGKVAGSPITERPWFCEVEGDEAGTKVCAF